MIKASPIKPVVHATEFTPKSSHFVRNDKHLSMVLEDKDSFVTPRSPVHHEKKFGLFSYGKNKTFHSSLSQAQKTKYQTPQGFSEKIDDGSKAFDFYTTSSLQCLSAATFQTNEIMLDPLKGTTFPSPFTARNSPFGHHEGSPFRTVSPSKRIYYRKSMESIPSAPTAAETSSHSLSHRLVPLKLIPPNKTEAPYDPFFSSKSFKSSPLVLSLSIIADSEKRLEDADAEQNSSLKSNHYDQVLPSPGYTGLSKVKLTPKFHCEKVNTQINRAGPMMDASMSIQHSTQSFASSDGLNASTFVLDPETGGEIQDIHTVDLTNQDSSSKDPILSMNVFCLNITSQAPSNVPNHFPCISEVPEQKSRSLLEPFSSHDPIHSLLCADAARPMDELTDDESDAECDVGFVLRPPMSINGEKHLPQLNKINRSTSSVNSMDDDTILPYENVFDGVIRKHDASSFLPMPLLSNRNTMVHEQKLSYPKFIEPRYNQDISVSSKSISLCGIQAVGDSLKQDHPNFCSYCPLDIVSDVSTPNVTERDLFTPSPTVDANYSQQSQSHTVLSMKRPRGIE